MGHPCHSRAWARALAPLGPRALTVLVDLSNQCNIRCRMCHFGFDSVFHRAPRYLEPRAFGALAAELLPLAHTAYLSASCEPLTSPHFVENLRVAARYAVPDLKFLTNGLLITPAIADAIVQCGVRQVHVSVDGATKTTYERIRRGARFERLLDNLRLLAERKRGGPEEAPWLQFNVTLMRSNLHELEAFVDLARELGVSRIACRHLVPYRGLDVEGESLAHCRAEANQRFRSFLDHIAAAPGVQLVNFPDLFDVDGERPSARRRRPWRRTQPPFGRVDRPAAPRLPGAARVALHGWALHERELVRVDVEREPLAGEPAGPPERDGRWLLGSPRLLVGARPDVAVAHPDLPHRFQSAWSFVVERSALPRDPGLVRVVVVAETPTGGRAVLGARELDYGSRDGRPHLFCERPFESVYVDATGSVYPYPDCDLAEAYGALGPGVAFEPIWHGAPYAELRRRIVEGDPPAMCETCADRINRQVDVGAYFTARDVREDDRPFGRLELPREDEPVLRERLAFEGWALARTPVEQVELWWEPPPGRDGGAAVRLARARLGHRPRPDVAAVYPRHARGERAGWWASLERRGLPAAAPRTLVVAVVARDGQGGAAVLGRRRVRLAQARPGR